jgi:hypothetical protein
MNLKQTRDWLASVSGCFPGLKTYAASAFVEKLAALAPSGSWEAGVSAAGFDAIDLRFLGGAGDPSWAAAAAKILGCAAPAAAAAPWLETRWDLRADALASSRLYGRERRAARFDPRAFPDAAVARALAEFAALAPAADRIVEGDRRWALRLARRLPWPAFLRCDISAGFTKNSAQFALLTPQHAVRELSFEGESLWVYFEG